MNGAPSVAEAFGGNRRLDHLDRFVVVMDTLRCMAHQLRHVARGSDELFGGVLSLQTFIKDV